MWFVVRGAPVPRASFDDERRWLALKVIEPKRAGFLRRLLHRLLGRLA